MPKSSLACEITRWSKRKETPIKDIVAVEEPLQVVVDGRPLAVLMRTPGDDEILVMGFLLTEGIIETISQVRSIDLEARDNHVMVFLSDDHECDWERLTRHLFSASSCGLCGKATVDAILQSHPPIGQRPEFDPVVIQSAPDTCEAPNLTLIRPEAFTPQEFFHTTESYLSFAKISEGTTPLIKSSARVSSKESILRSASFSSRGASHSS